MTKPHKAVLAFILTFIGALVATVQGREESLESMKVLDWLVVVGAALVTAGGVYGIRNPPVSAR